MSLKTRQHLKSLAITVGLTLSVLATVYAQTQLPEEIVPSRTVERFAKGTFLESIVARRDGSLLFVDHKTHTIYKMTPAGKRTILVDHDAELRGLGLDIADTVYVTGRQKNGMETVFKVSHKGRIEPWVDVPGGRFLNGMGLLRPGEFLVADSFGGLIWRIDIRERSAKPWLRHALLATNPDDERIPGPNGVKIYDGHAYISNSALAKIIRVRINADGSAGTPAEFANGIVIDDFAFSKTGNLYGTTHIFNTVVVLRRDGSRATIAGPDQGVTGSTAAAFGATTEDAQTLYVIGDGGVFLPPDGGIVPAEFVALDVGESGLTPVESLSWVDRPKTVNKLPAYMVRCKTAPDTDSLRPIVGPAYLRYLELNADRIAFAGQIFDYPGASPTERIYFLITGDRSEARQYIEASPYFTAGLYSGCEVKSFNAMIGTLLGGVGWPTSATDMH